MQIVDARGNPFQGDIDVIGGETFTDARVSSATFGALNAELLMDLNGKATAMFDVRTAAGSLTVVFEGTVDGTNYFAIPAFAIAQTLGGTLTAEQYVPSVIIATTTSGIYELTVSGFRRVRCRCSAFTSGTVVVAGRASTADNSIYAREVPSTLAVSATAAANTNATATLPAAGVGMFHYITHIDVMRNATAAVAGTATLIHTTTNLPGSLAWSVGNAIIAGGTEKDVLFEPTTPLKSSVANTATTVVCVAAGLGVLGRINVTYYVGS